jgi:predicted nucleic acid-binding protein
LIESLGETSRAAGAVLDAVADRRLRRSKTAWHCCLEFYSVSTRLPAEFRLSPETALTLLEEEVLGRFEVQQLPDATLRSFLQEAAADSIVGGRVYDVHIGAIAQRSGAKVVVTNNRRHFAPLIRHGLQILDARELLDRLKAS